jgi:ech hydrogenase subunit A
MIPLIYSLIAVPWIVAALLLFAPKALGKFLVILCAGALSVISIAVFAMSGAEPIKFDVPPAVHTIMLGADVLMLVYFVGVAFKYRNKLVGIMAGLQIGMLAMLLMVTKSSPMAHATPFLVDRLSMFMFLLVNIVSGIIAVFALKYIDEENVSEQRKRNFMAIIMWFVGVMNFLVSVDNLEWFFLLFECTTLASFWLIRFRGDAISVRNSLRALWMNQLGGVALLAGMLAAFQAGYNTLNLSSLVSQASGIGIMLPFAFIAVAALIKGAQMPFSSWLLGAMVAPTPVSALLHSSTMVKIAPYTMLRIAPAIAGSALSYTIMLLCAFVFVVAALGALARANFKEILAHSTIALLSLMCLLAAVGSELAIMAALFLVLFHGVSKCLLFLQAGVLERVFHLKYTTELQKLGDVGPTTSLMIAFGFVSLMLPPFGAFVGKWLGLELLAGNAKAGAPVVSILIIAAIILGSAMLTFLYFKVIGALFSRSGEFEIAKSEKMSGYYFWAPATLVALLVLGMIGLAPLTNGILMPVVAAVRGEIGNISISGFDLMFGTSTLAMWPMMGALLLFPAMLIASRYVRFRGVDRATEYNCSERYEQDFASYYFSFEKLNPWFILMGVLFFVSIVLVGRLPL